MGLKAESPFTPGNPVPLELFVGRQEQINQVLEFLKRTNSGKQQNVFLVGSRGIGKSSIACLLGDIAEKNMNMISVHLFVGGISDLDELIRRIIEEVLNESKGQEWFDSIRSLFKDIEEVGVGGLSLKFSPKVGLADVKKHFSEVLSNLIDKLQGKKTGIFITLDDINGFSKNEEFTKWYKSFVDTIATHYKDFPVLIMLVGYPEGRDTLFRQEPSLQRIFEPIELERLSNTDVEQFFKKAFSKVGMTVDKDALKEMVTYSSGLPVIMHEIGDAVFLCDEDKRINEEDALHGIWNAAERVGKKYLESKVYHTMRSIRYRSILRKMFPKDSFPSKEFTKHELEKNLDDKEKRVLHNFLRKLKELQVIEQNMELGRGSYNFVNDIYPVYIWMESLNKHG